MFLFLQCIYCIYIYIYWEVKSYGIYNIAVLFWLFCSSKHILSSILCGNVWSVYLGARAEAHSCIARHVWLSSRRGCLGADCSEGERMSADRFSKREVDMLWKKKKNIARPAMCTCAHRDVKWCIVQPYWAFRDTKFFVFRVWHYLSISKFKLCTLNLRARNLFLISRKLPRLISPLNGSLRIANLVSFWMSCQRA